MLDRAHRLTNGRLIAHTIRRGRRAGNQRLVVHFEVSPGDGDPPRLGLVVGKAVGNAVARNQVKRRLRHLVRERLADLPAGASLVVRALPSSAGATSAELDADLTALLGRVSREQLSA